MTKIHSPIHSPAGKELHSNIVYSEQTGLDYIEVVEKGEFRCLSFGEDVPYYPMSIASPQQLTSPYLEVMTLAMIFSSMVVHRVLLLGLAGGSMVRFLRYYFPNISLSVIEASAPMFDLCQKYFFLPEGDDRLRLYCADVDEMLRLKRRPKEIIFVDILPKNQPTLVTEIFFKHCYGRFQKDGLLVSHVCLETKEAEQHYVSTLASVFQGGILGVSLPDTTQVIVAFKEHFSLNKQLAFYQKRAREFKKITGVDLLGWLKKIKQVS